MPSFYPPGSSSRFVELREPRGAVTRENRPTVLCGAPLGAHPRLFHQRFLSSYEGIRRVATDHGGPGVALVAVDEHGIAASGWLAAKVGEMNSAVIGRHQAAAILLAGDETLSLRHLLLLVYPMRAGQDVRYRVLDLRTPSAFADERGRRLGALEAEGAAFVMCGRYCLFLLPTGDGLAWPDNPATGWSCIPERIYFGEHGAEPDRWQRGEHLAPAAASPRPVGHPTLRAMPCPTAARRALLGPGESARGEVRICSASGRDALTLGPVALRDGVLLGRYDRCDSHGLAALSDSRVSRVHCLLIEVDGALYAVDLASQNGLYVRVPGPAGAPAVEHRIGVLPLCSGDELSLGAGVNVVRWQAADRDAATGRAAAPVIVSPLVH